MIVKVQAPVRIDFAGGWSDVPTFADEFGGAVVNVAITRYVIVHARPWQGVQLVADDFGESISCSGTHQLVYDGELDLHKAAVKMSGIANDVFLRSSASVPPGSGLGTSGALDVALIAALWAFQGRATDDRVQLAEAAFELEAGELGLLGGRQDQYAAAFGGFRALDFEDSHVAVRKIAVADDFMKELRDAMVLVYTGQTHFSSATHERVWERFHDGVPEVRTTLHELKCLAEPAADALQSGDLESLARVIDTNWQLQKALHHTIATPATDAVEAAARKAGAIGAKATGAGAGGCMIFLGEPDVKPAIVKAVKGVGATVLDYRFDQDGVCVATE